jgi:hypothetical protein
VTLTITEGEKHAIECAEGCETIFWRIPLESLVLVAEYTTPHGPLQDDYFLVFGYREQGKCYFRDVPFDALGAEVVLARLSAMWQDKLHFGLCDSTDWKSRVIWPRQLVDQEYLTFSEVAPRSIWQRLRKMCIGPKYECSTSVQVATYLGHI